MFNSSDRASSLKFKLRVSCLGSEWRWVWGAAGFRVQELAFQAAAPA